MSLTLKILNPATGKYVLKTGKIGKALLLSKKATAKKNTMKKKTTSKKTTTKKKITKDEKRNVLDGTAPIKIVSYNIHNGWYNEDESENTFPQMCTWLRKVNPDVVLFQEVTFREVSKAQFETQMKKMGLSFIAYGFAADLYGKEGGNFFGQATCSRIPFDTRPTSQSLKRDPVQNEGRNALFVTLRASGLTICNTHLDVWDRTGKTRLQQIKQIDDTLNQFNLFPALVCGDFNTQRRHDYTTAQWNALIKSKYELETLALDHVQSMGVKDVLDLVGKKSASSIPNLNRRIDFMFVFDPYNTLTVQAAEIDKNANFSDHYPVIATVSGI
jgi:endonuclease/exonuclease/phosphatase family metal-dependent hydrolase